MDAKLAERAQLLWHRVVQKTGKAGDRNKILRVFGCDQECTETAIGIARNVKFAAGDVVIGKQPGEKRRKNLLAAFEEQHVIRRRGLDHDIAAAFGLRPKISV